MADASDPTAGLPDLQSLLGGLVSQIPQNIQDTQSQMGALQDYIKNQQKDQLNIPALQFAAGLLKPTRTGSFGESVGEAGSGALDSLQKQRGIDLDRQAKILELQQAKGQLLNQQVQMLMPLALQQSARAAWNGDANATPIGSAAPAAGGSPQAGAPSSMPSAPPVDAVQAQLLRHQNMMAYYAKLGNSQGVEAEARAITALTGTSPNLAGAIAGAKGAAEHAASAPYEMVEITMPDGSKAKVPLSSIVHPGAAPGSAPMVPPVAPPERAPVVAPPAGGSPPAQAASGLPPGGIQTAPSAAQETGIKMAATEAEKIPEALESLAQQDQRMASIDDIMQKYKTGAFSEPKADALAALRALGMDVKDTDTASPEALQEFRKNSIGQVFDKLKEYGGQVRVAEITGLGKIVTDPDLQPGANQAISSQIRGVIDWRKQMLSDYASAYHSGGITDPATWKDQWITAHPVGDYVSKRLAQTPVMGVAPDKVANGALGIADKDYADPNGNVTVKKGDKFMKLDNHAVPVGQIGAYYEWKATH